MGVFEGLEKLRQYPESRRKKILAGTVFAVMALVTALWLANLDFRFGPQVSEEKGSEPAPWKVVKSTFGRGWADFKDSLKLEQR